MEDVKPATLKILVVDDHALLREGLKATLANETDLQVAAEAADIASAKAQLDRARFDLALVDIGLPDSSGMLLLRTIKADFPETKVLMLSSYPEHEYGPQSLREGADGFISKSAPSLLIARAIRVVASGAQYVSASLLRHLAESTDQSRARKSSRTNVLSARELEVLRYLATGKGATEIGEILHLSVKTVSTYRARILQKTGVKTNAELVRYAMHRGHIP